MDLSLGFLFCSIDLQFEPPGKDLIHCSVYISIPISQFIPLSLSHRVHKTDLYFLTPYTKINSKWIKDLNIRPETIKLLEESIGKTLSDINHSRMLYDPPPRVMEIKAKINKWDIIKLKTFSQRRKL